LLSQYLIVKIAKKYSIQSIIHVQDIYPESLLQKLPFFKKIFFKLLLPIDIYSLKNSSHVVTISLKIKKYLIESRDLKEGKVGLVYNWQNEEMFLENRNANDKVPKDNFYFTFMFLGSLNKTSSIESIISAFGTSRLENARLVIAGNGSKKSSLKSLAESFKRSKIEFWDVPMLDVPITQNKADVLILSLKRGASQFAFPSKIIAYMLSEKPIIACVDKDSDTANAIEQANCGWIVPAEDEEALAQTMIMAVSEKESVLRSYGRNGFNYALENYSKKTNLQKLLTIINHTLMK